MTPMEGGGKEVRVQKDRRGDRNLKGRGQYHYANSPPLPPTHTQAGGEEKKKNRRHSFFPQAFFFRQRTHREAPDPARRRFAYLNV